MVDTARVMSNREYDKFLKERKLEAFKRCDPLVQGRLFILTYYRVCALYEGALPVGCLGVSSAEQQYVQLLERIVGFICFNKVYRTRRWQKPRRSTWNEPVAQLRIRVSSS